MQRGQRAPSVVAPKRCAEPLLLLLLLACPVLCVQDDFYLRHLIKNNLLDPVMDAFFSNGDRYNLLNSAVLEMVEFIRKENLKVSRRCGRFRVVGYEGSGMPVWFRVTPLFCIWQESQAGRSW
jgi:hypothetical protein